MILIEHPDVQIEGLRKELAMYPDNEDVRKSIERLEHAPKPDTPKVGSDGMPVADRKQAFLDGLYKELSRTPEPNRAAVQAEIDRIENHREPANIVERAVAKVRTQKAVKNTDDVE